MNSFYYTVTKDTIFVRVPYKKNISYIYPHFDNGLSSLTVGISDPNIGKLEEILTNIATMVSVDQAMENPMLQDKIVKNYPNLRTD